jgi:plastocyanin
MMGRLMRVAGVTWTLSRFTLVLCIFFLMSCSKSIQISENEPKLRIHVVKIEKFKFLPKTIMVSKGDFVRWENQDIVPHQIAEGTLQKWRSRDLLTNDSFTLKIHDSTSYICKLHPTMQAEIVVRFIEE